ncbi:hypothetical protein A2U01_0057439 [Trifolium medium]|uniref:Uncharacterized protein n=1 Tax=Trifolium medium TaxID=97028 RepID=A0A392RJ13_9FABA|nr:hypothetical protein [Trifolium medium]
MVPRQKPGSPVPFMSGVCILFLAGTGRVCQVVELGIRQFWLNGGLLCLSFLVVDPLRGPWIFLWWWVRGV